MKLEVATCQFPVSADIEANLAAVLAQMAEARSRGAEVAHFPEACLSGYAEVDFASFVGFSYERLRQAMRAVMRRAGELRLWVVIGAAHELSPGRKPHNSSYIIDAQGLIVDRYDKLFCAGDKECRSGDLAHYTPGSHFAVFAIKGVRCGALICHDYRYPELYREYKKRGVELMFHSFHAGGVALERHEAMLDYVGRDNRHLGEGGTLPAITMPAGMIASASNNHVWISCPNSSAKVSCWPSFFVRPDGVITGALATGKTSVLVSSVDTEADLYDSTVAWRERAMSGVFHSGEPVEDARSQARQEL